MKNNNEEEEEEEEEEDDDKAKVTSVSGPFAANVRFLLFLRGKPETPRVPFSPSFLGFHSDSNRLIGVPCLN